MRNVPAGDADEFEWLIFEQAGVLTTAQAEQLRRPGIVQGHLRQGRWRRICRGLLLAENGRLMRDQQLWVSVLVAGPDARLAGPVAAAENGVRSTSLPGRAPPSSTEGSTFLHGGLHFPPREGLTRCGEGRNRNFCGVMS